MLDLKGLPGTLKNGGAHKYYKYWSSAAAASSPARLTAQGIISTAHPNRPITERLVTILQGNLKPGVRHILLESSPSRSLGKVSTRIVFGSEPLQRLRTHLLQGEIYDPFMRR
jgi:hypothetical protein